MVKRGIKRELQVMELTKPELLMANINKYWFKGKKNMKNALLS